MAVHNLWAMQGNLYFCAYKYSVTMETLLGLLRSGLDYSDALRLPKLF